MNTGAKIGFGFAGLIAVVAVAAYFFSSPPQMAPTKQLENLKQVGPVPSLGSTTPNPNSVQSPSASPADGRPSVLPSQAAVPAVPASPASGTVANKAQRAEQKLAREKAVSNLSTILAKGVQADPKEVSAALNALEKTIPTAEGKKQIAMSRLIYEQGNRAQALALELGQISKTNLPQNKQRQQDIITELTAIQLNIKNATDATRQFAAEQIRRTQ